MIQVEQNGSSLW